MNTVNFKSLRIAATLIATLFLTYLALGWADSTDVTRYHFLRFEPVRRQFGGLPLGKPAVAFLGPSDVALNVSPNQIKDRLPGVEVYNFGVVMAAPDTLRVLSAEMKRALLKRNEKFDLVAMRFLPMMFTKRSRKFASATRYPLFTYKLPFFHILEYATWNGLDYLAHVLYLRIVRGGAAQGAWQLTIRQWLSQYVYDDRPIIDPTYYRSLWHRDILAPHGVFWNPATGGEIDLYAAPHDLSAFIAEHRKDIYEVGFNSHWFLFDPTELDFDEGFFRDFDRTIDDLREVAEKVVVFYLPDFYSPGSAGLSSAGAKRLAERVNELKKDPRIIFWDYSSFPMSSENFFDISHMTKRGKRELNRWLAESLRAALRK